jgi:flagellar biosynthesis/type III secretory pathway protein FliH
MQEQHSGVRGLSDVQYVFVELPKYVAGPEPEGAVDRWAYFFREAENFKVIPPILQESPFSDALEVARTALFTRQEWDAYDSAKIAEQDARGALILAHREGREEGREQGREEGREQGHEEGREQGHEEGRGEGEARGYAEAVLRVIENQNITLDAKSRQAILECQDMALLKRLFDKALVGSSASEILAELAKAD